MTASKLWTWLMVSIAAAALAAALVWEESRPAQLPAAVMVEIEAGTGARAITASLREAGVLRNNWPFLAWHYLHLGKRKLKAGEYRFEGTVSVLQAYEKLARGDIFFHALTIPEGYNLFDVAAAVERAGFAKAQAFLEAAHNTALVADLAPEARSLEGFLFPDTYHFARRTAPPEITAAMVARFRQVYAGLTRNMAEQVLPVLRVVTLASLVEKETGRAAERPLVAGVFQNRLLARMPLDCDPTVIYAVMLDGRYRGTIYASDLKRKSPYNTYRRIGLPPGPVANPGRASLEAALRPASTKYLYFVSDAAGGHIFSRTLAEHRRNVVSYRRKNNSKLSKGHAPQGARSRTG